MLSGSNLDLTIIWAWFFYISMLLYGKMLKLAELSHFLADFGPVQKMVFAVKFELLGQIRPNFEFRKQNKFLTSGEKDNSMLHHLGWKKWQKHGENFTPNDLYYRVPDYWDGNVFAHVIILKEKTTLLVKFVQSILFYCDYWADIVIQSYASYIVILFLWDNSNPWGHPNWTYIAEVAGPSFSLYLL